MRVWLRFNQDEKYVEGLIEITPTDWVFFLGLSKYLIPNFQFIAAATETPKEKLVYFLFCLAPGIAWILGFHPSH